MKSLSVFQQTITILCRIQMTAITLQDFWQRNLLQVTTLDVRLTGSGRLQEVSQIAIWLMEEPVGI